jgi:hypothetical protein
MKKALLTIEIEYDEEATDSEGVAYAIDRLIETARCQVALEEYGNPNIGEAFVAMEDGKLTPYGKKKIGPGRERFSRGPSGIGIGSQ